MRDSIVELKNIYHRAIEISSATERAAYLEEACRGDTEIRAEVDALLKVKSKADGFFAGLCPPPNQTLGDANAERPGTVIGPYKLVEELGEGGMGTVFLAQQMTPVKRLVALKVIKRGMDTRQVIARFEAERQALALMDHPHIARVHDAGATEGGRPYFVMELVRGTPIAAYCDERRLPIHERLDLFVQVCQAVQHAHQKGVIHRDLKPSNVLVAPYDGRPVVKVIDFGVAKAAGNALTELTLVTGFGAVVGTLEYMSPEQAELNNQDIDTRSDIYSLGVLLFELLTGSTPLQRRRAEETGFVEALRLIREEEAPTVSQRLSNTAELPAISAQRGLEPSRLKRIVRGELDWIVMKSLEKDRNRRYETANGLAADIRRYLNDEPVQACPPSATYRLRKLARRYRAPIAIFAGFLVLSLVATTVSSWLAVRAMKAESLAAARLTTERMARAQAVTEAAKATAISDLLQALISSANPDQAKGADYTVRRLLDDASHRMDNQLPDQPEVEAAIRSAIGNAYRRLGDMAKSEVHLHRALELRRADAERSLESKLLLAQSLSDFAYSQRRKGKGAEKHALEAVEIHRQCGVRDERLLNHLSTLLLLLCDQQRFDEAIVVGEEAVALGRELFPEGNGEVAIILHRLSSAMQQKKDLPSAEALVREGIEMHLRYHGQEHVETAWAIFNLGTIEFELGRPADAEINMRRALSIFLKQYGESHYSVGVAMDGMTHVLEAQKKYGELAALQSEITTRKLRTAERETNNLSLRIELGCSLRDGGNLEGAMAIFTEVEERLTPETSPALIVRLAESYSLVAQKFRHKMQWEAAEEAFSRAISLRASLTEPSSEVRLAQANSFNDLAFVHLPAQRPEEAEQALRRALAIKQDLAAEFPENCEFLFHLAHTQLGFALFWEESGNRQETEAALLEADTLFQELAQDATALRKYREHPGHSLWRIGNFWGKLGRSDDSEQAFVAALRSFEWLEREYPANAYFRLEQGFSYREIAKIRQSDGFPRDAEAFLRSALVVYERLVGDYPADGFYRQEEACVHELLGTSLEESADYEEAVKHRLRQVRLQGLLVQEFPQEGEHRRRLLAGRAGLIVLLAALDRVDEARREVEALSALSPAVADWHGMARELCGRRALSAAAAQLAVELAQQAVQDGRQSGLLWHTLGLAHFRAGEMPEALAALEQARQRNQEAHFGADAFLLALVHARLENQAVAQSWLLQAREWWESHPAEQGAVLALRTEVEESFEEK